MPEIPSILLKIIQKKKLRLAQAKEEQPLSELKVMVRDLPETKDFSKAIRVETRVNIIAEIKRRSPSQGLIRKDFDIVELLRAYEQGGAEACSILTEEDFFGGSLEALRRIRALTAKPLLRKDFIFDPYQLYESREAGADAVLLITAALNQDQLQDLLTLSTELHLSALVEVHTREELRTALNTGAEIMGINNRDLNTFSVNLNTTVELKQYIPPGKIVVSESGIGGPSDIRCLFKAGINAFLIGEYFMRKKNIAQAVRELKGSL
ncbi:Indole-3-glycerol phosphate synthase [subsurface metagenome]